MLPRADLNITAVARVEAIARLDGIGEARQEAFQRAMSSLLGQPLQGKIVSKLTDGSYVVELAGASARMLLPAGAKVGAELPMTLVSLTPRPTFQVGAALAQASLVQAEALPLATTAGAAQVPESAAARAAGPQLPGHAPLQSHASSVALHASAVLGQGALAGSALAAAAAPPSAPAILSPTAQLLSGVLSLAAANPNHASAIVGATPLMAAPGAPPAQLAAALHQAVARSGLFYESHVAQWAAGQRSIAELANEPQMQRNAATAPLLADDSIGAQMINLQLQTQEQARVAWQGQPWPGQEMRWEIERDEGHATPRGDAEPAAPGWRSALHLRFELLGEIGARLFMAGDQVQLQLDTGDSAIGALLRARSGELGTALDAAGITLGAFSVRGPQEAHDA